VHAAGEELSTEQAGPWHRGVSTGNGEGA
jgi:hypothetical protein